MEISHGFGAIFNQFGKINAVSDVKSCMESLEELTNSLTIFKKACSKVREDFSEMTRQENSNDDQSDIEKAGSFKVTTSGLPEGETLVWLLSKANGAVSAIDVDRFIGQCEEVIIELHGIYKRYEMQLKKDAE